MPDPAGGPRRDAHRELERTDAVFAALSHPARRHVLLVLRFRGGEMTAGEIAQRFACTWATTSRHLAVLRKAGLVRVEKRGRERAYRLNTDALVGEVGGWLRWFTKEPPFPRSPAAPESASGPPDAR